MKALFLIFHGFDEANGISKKIRYQIKALKTCGIDVRTCYYDVDSQGHRKWMADKEMLKDFGTGTLAKIRKRFCFKAIYAYILRENIRFVYIRSYHNANPFTIRFVSQIKKKGVKIAMEIPTYPYDQEYIILRMKCDLWIDRIFRNSLARQVDRIVTFSNATQIFGQNTIRISNGIDFDAIPLKKQRNDTSLELHLIGVAEIHYWHGFDRVIKGLAEYYHASPVPEYKVYFHIVGTPFSEREQQELLIPLKENKLEKYVLMHGPKFGEELDMLFEQADFAIGSLGRHRSGITYIKTLKNREYAARGFAFAYSETDEDFEDMPYILKIPADESPVNIKRLIEFQRSLILTPVQIRDSIQNLSWTTQMRKVVDDFLLH